MKIINVVGARPNFMKIAPIIRAIKKTKIFNPVLLHTGQHYDQKMSDSFFKDLGIPKPDISLGVGSGTHAEQTAKIMLGFEKILRKEKPNLVLVVGDVNSTLACSIVSAKLNIPVAHVEAGLRSFDRSMPEEINRIVTDSLSDYLFITCEDANQNLLREGVSRDKIFFVGNTMIDTLYKLKGRIDKNTYWQTVKEPFALLTLHRPSNVDNKENFLKILKGLEKIQEAIKIIFPIHPRTKKNIKRMGLNKMIKKMPNLHLLEPLSYFNFMSLIKHAQVVFTDSGGIQEETTVLGVPCLTLRENTERPVTITQGTNTLVGIDTEKIISTALTVIKNGKKREKIPELWDGKTAERIVQVFQEKLV